MKLLERDFAFACTEMSPGSMKAKWSQGTASRRRTALSASGPTAPTRTMSEHQGGQR